MAGCGVSASSTSSTVTIAPSVDRVAWGAAVLALLFLLFVAVPIVEIAVIIKVGDWLGLWPTLALLIGDSILGAVLMRSQGRAVWRRFTQALSEGRPPAREFVMVMNAFDTNFDDEQGHRDCDHGVAECF